MKHFLLKITSLSVLAVFCAGLLLQSLIVVDFYWHRDTIAAEKCINKDKPELHCEGSCYLKNKLKETSKEQNPSLPENIESFDYIAEPVINDSYTLEHTYFLLSEYQLFYKNHYVYQPVFEIPHPPQV